MIQELPYLDYLQSPLQPLMDNLESQTYEIFERDPVKYKKYQEVLFPAPSPLPLLSFSLSPLSLLSPSSRSPLSPLPVLLTVIIGSIPSAAR